MEAITIIFFIVLAVVSLWLCWNILKFIFKVALIGGIILLIVWLISTMAKR